ncbi:MAG: hypothetical protein QW761_00175 [Candidatus Aenigmatarchaeota archaeon]
MPEDVKSSLAYWKRYQDRSLPEEHELWLRSIFGNKLSGNAPLPAELLNSYWRMKEILDRAGLPMTVRDLCWVVWDSQLDIEEPKAATVADLFAKGLLKRLSFVEVERGGQWVRARIVGEDRRSGTVRLIVDGDGSARDYPIEKTRLYKAEKVAT